MNLPFYEMLEKKMNALKDQSGLRLAGGPLLALGLLEIIACFVLFYGTMQQAMAIAFFLSPLWLPPLILGAAGFMYMTLINSKWIASRQYVLLEIKPPRNLVKTPL